MLSNMGVFRNVIRGFSIPAGYFYNVLDNPIISILYNVLDNPIISISIYLHNIMHRINVIQK